MSYLEQVFGIEAISALVLTEGSLAERIHAANKAGLSKLRETDFKETGSEGYKKFRDFLSSSNTNNEEAQSVAKWIIEMALKYNLSRHHIG